MSNVFVYPRTRSRVAAHPSLNGATPMPHPAISTPKQSDFFGRAGESGGVLAILINGNWTNCHTGARCAWCAEHRMVAFRLVGLKSGPEQARVLREAVVQFGNTKTVTT